MSVEIMGQLEKALKRVSELERSIAKHRDAKGHDRCWINDEELYAMLPGGRKGDPELPPKAEFLSRCDDYYECQRRRQADA